MVQQAGATDPDRSGNVVQRGALVPGLRKAVQSLDNDHLAGGNLLSGIRHRNSDDIAGIPAYRPVGR